MHKWISVLLPGTWLAKRALLMRSGISVRAQIHERFPPEMRSCAEQQFIRICRLYRLPSDKVRLNDRVSDIAKTDFFGDAALAIEAELSKNKIEIYNPNTMKLEELVRQLCTIGNNGLR